MTTACKACSEECDEDDVEACDDCGTVLCSECAADHSCGDDESQVAAQRELERR
jgi:hypothetical protein